MTLFPLRWREVVRGDEAVRYEAAASAEDEEEFTMRPPGRRDVYYVTRYSYRSRSRVGQDARAIPGILTGLERARDTGETVISSQTTLDETGTSRGRSDRSPTS